MTPKPDSPQARLAASRKALVRYMARDDARADNDASNGSHDSAHAQTSARPGTNRNSTWHVFTQSVLAWWQHHPMHVAVDIGRPFLNNYARDKPLQLIGIAAGLGAAAIFVKPWRLVSVTGLAVAALKSSKLSTTLLSLLQRTAPRPYARQTQQSFEDTP